MPSVDSRILVGESIRESDGKPWVELCDVGGEFFQIFRTPHLDRGNQSRRKTTFPQREKAHVAASLKRRQHHIRCSAAKSGEFAHMRMEDGIHEIEEP